jgi:hypothetical protein
VARPKRKPHPSPWTHPDYAEPSSRLSTMMFPKLGGEARRGERRVPHLERRVYVTAAILSQMFP